jgi:branched-chain amino acid transport system permease protein
VTTQRVSPTPAHLRGARPLWYPVGLVVVLIFVRFFVLSPADLYLVSLMAVYALASLGLNILFGLGGMLSLAQAAVMALGGYTSALLITKADWPFLAAVLCGALFGAAVSALASLASLRVATHYFVLVTLAVAESISLVLVNEDQITGGFNGLFGIPPITMAGFDFSQPWPLAALTITVLFIGWYVADAFRASRTGFATVASSADPQMAVASGINIAKVRVVAGVVGGFYAGVAGALFAEVLQFLGPSDFELSKTLLFLLIVVIGGLGSNAGTVVAAVILTYLSQGLLELRQVGPLVYGVAIMVILVVMPDGLAGIAQKLRDVVRAGSRRRARR